VSPDATRRTTKFFAELAEVRERTAKEVRPTHRTRLSRPATESLQPALLIFVNGFLALVTLSALIGVWFGRSGD
jgi:hypothetical protein